MNGIDYLREARDRYVDRYRAVLRAKRDEGAECTAEVWVEPNVPPGEPRPPHPICIDILVQCKDGPPSINMVADEPADGPLIDTLTVGGVPVKVYAANWEALVVWFHHHDPDWAALDPWRKKWMDADRGGRDEEDGLSGVVHYLGRPVAEAGGYLYQIDFGSAPLDALTELLDALVAMGADEIELGRSDGSDLPADMQAELRQPDLPLARLTAIVCRLLSALSEVARVERLNDESIAAYVKSAGHPHRIFLGNLHRLLMRTGVEARAREVNRYIRGQRESMVPALPPDLPQLRLLVKDERFLNNVRQQVPDMKPLVRRHLAGDLWLVCVWDAPNGMRFATEDEAGQYELTPEQMFQRAKANYLENRPPVEMSEHGSLLVAQTRDCYDATLLIDAKWWGEVREKVSGDILACVPARNLVLIGGAGRPETLPQMRDAARKIEAGGDHLISGTILIRRDGNWEVHHHAPDAPASGGPPPDASAPSASPAPKRAWWRFW